MVQTYDWFIFESKENNNPLQGIHSIPFGETINAISQFDVIMEKVLPEPLLQDCGWVHISRHSIPYHRLLWNF